MINRYKNIVIVVLLPLLLTGCWDYKDVNKRDIIISIGVDQVDNSVEFTGEAAKLMSAKGGGSTMMAAYEYISLGKEYEGSRADYDAEIPGPYFAGAVRCVVFSKKFGAKGIEPYMNRLYNIVGFRNSVLIVISEEAPRDLFSRKIENDICVGYGIEDTVKYLDDNGGALYKTVQEIISDIQFRGVGYFIPYVTVDKGTAKYLGLGAMKDSKLVGIVKSGDSAGILFLLSKHPTNEGVFASPSNEKKLLAIKTTLGKRRIKTSYKDKNIHIDIDLKLKSQLQYEYNIGPLSKQDIKKLEERISTRIKDSILAVTKRSQKEFKSDVFGFARYFKGENPEVYKSMDWSKEYQNAIFDVNVDTTIVNTNLLDPNAEKQIK
jgi:spore germination protein KC